MQRHAVEALYPHAIHNKHHQQTDTHSGVTGHPRQHSGAIMMVVRRRRVCQSGGRTAVWRLNGEQPGAMKWSPAEWMRRRFGSVLRLLHPSVGRILLRDGFTS